MNTPILHLFIPGLLGPFAGDLNPWLHAHPDLPALQWLLARATLQSIPHTGADATLCTCFGLPDANVPVAALTRLADDHNARRDDAGWWLRADPVHLRPDVHTVMLADARVLQITAAEADALVAALNATFTEDGLHFSAPHPNRWYLQLTADPNIQTHPLIDVIGRDIRAFLPDGPEKRRWHTLLTEMQMLLYQHPVNQAREARHLPLINSVWLWGEGHCPTQTISPATGLYADDSLVQGLAKLADRTVYPTPENAQMWWESAHEQTSSLVVLDTTRCDPADDDPYLWATHCATLETAWFAPCQQWLRSGKLAAIHLYPCNGRYYTITGTARWQFWRRATPLSQYILQRIESPHA